MRLCRILLASVWPVQHHLPLGALVQKRKERPLGLPRTTCAMPALLLSLAVLASCFASHCSCLPPIYMKSINHLSTHTFDHALQVLEKVRGTPNVDAEYDDILEACDISHALAGKWRVLFTQKYRPVLVGSGESEVVLRQVLPGDPSCCICTPALMQSWHQVCWRCLHSAAAATTPTGQHQQDIQLTSRHCMLCQGAVLYCCAAAAAITQVQLIMTDMPVTLPDDALCC